ncbi:MAG: hypothetical protein AAF125_16710 [Chloroflexota bacterium]
MNYAQFATSNAGAGQAFAVLSLLVLLALLYAWIVIRIQPGWGVYAKRVLVLPYWPIWYPVQWLQRNINIQTKQPLLWIVLMATAVRIPGMTNDLWYDETFTAAVIDNGFLDMMRAVAVDVHPPLAYLPFWTWTQLFPPTAPLLRIPALLFGVGAVILVYRLALSLRLPPVQANITALLVALLPAQIHYSTEARAYTLFTCMTFIAAITLFEGKRGWFTAAAFSLPLIHVYGYLYLVGFGLAALMLHGRCWIMPLALLATATAAYLPIVLIQSGDVADGFWIPPFVWTDPLYSLPASFTSHHISKVVVIHVWLGLVAIAALAAAWLDWKRRDVALLMLILTPVLAAAVISAGWRNIYLHRAIMPAATLFVIPWTRLLFEPRARHTLRTFTLVLAVLAIAGIRPRSDIAKHYELCSNADAAYFTEVAGAIVGAYYLDMPIYVWTEAGDLNQQLPIDSWQYYGLIPADQHSVQGTVCHVDYTTPASQQREQDYQDTFPPGFTIWTDTNTLSKTEVVIYDW